MKKRKAINWIILSKKAQVSMEYLIVIGFVTFIILTILGIAFFYTNSSKDKLIMTQANNFANKIIATAESVYYAGKPSKATISAYLPDGVTGISIENNELVLNITAGTGKNVIGFPSNVPLSDTSSITSTEGIKEIEIRAEENNVVITQV
jgi:uncharacterized protein (UPF0333 family)